MREIKRASKYCLNEYFFSFGTGIYLLVSQGNFTLNKNIQVVLCLIFLYLWCVHLCVCACVCVCMSLVRKDYKCYNRSVRYKICGNLSSYVFLEISPLSPSTTCPSVKKWKSVMKIIAFDLQICSEKLCI